MAYTGRLRPKGVFFFRLQVYERVGILLFEVYERIVKSVISVYKKSPEEQTDTFYGCETVEKTFRCYDLFLF